jgi:predicted transcriptional regulator
MKVILSIKPRFANKIFSGEKTFEFRKAIFKEPGVDTVLVYASAPISKIIGEFKIEEIYHESVISLWLKTSRGAGISEDYFNEYFKGRDNGYAIKIKSTKMYKSYQCIKKDFGLHPPQSFAYYRG